MKKAFLTAALAAVVSSGAVFSGNVMAHGNHGSIDEKGAVAVAARTVQKMTFSDLELGLGQLDSSWRTVKRDQVSIVEEDEYYYVVEVKNAESGEPIYLQVMTNGNVISVSKDR